MSRKLKKGGAKSLPQMNSKDIEKYKQEAKPYLKFKYETDEASGK